MEHHHGSLQIMKTIMGFLVTVLAIASNAAAAQGVKAGSMNLISIVTDDQAAWTLGCYGGTEIPIPNLDRLAVEGVRFVNAFVHTPVCSPSRGTYMTGLQSTQLGFTDWLNDRQARVSGITSSNLTWPGVLARHGYATGLIGKWHLGAQEESRPWRNGLTEFTGNLGGGWAPNRVSFIDEKGGSYSPQGFSVEICTDLAIKFVDGHKGKPFALLLHFREPHGPYVPMPEKDMETSRHAKLKIPDYPGLRQPYTTDARRNYYASIAALDRNIGRLLEHLDKTGLAKRSIHQRPRIQRGRARHATQRQRLLDHGGPFSRAAPDHVRHIDPRTVARSGPRVGKGRFGGAGVGDEPRHVRECAGAAGSR